ncbi:hypothetical protein [Compostimonas suwonensis]|uniref:hypothetical protein n=1 Tax=Compostimonas suwonensis TaxID=1048394 RepID=UPI0012FD01BD|nr:hypothetical protein [Compostimonas suwonensis]
MHPVEGVEDRGEWPASVAAIALRAALGEDAAGLLRPEELALLRLWLDRIAREG